MNKKRVCVLAATATLAVAGVVNAAHVTTIDPGTIPTGFLTAHTEFAHIPMSAIARIAAADGADMTIQHVRLGPNTATGWHTHPGPAIVSIAQGSFTYEDVGAGDCRQRNYTAGEGFVDPGSGHVHRGIAGPTGVDFYVVYVMPPGASGQTIPAAPLEACLN
jgi:quercetin dioxygenase-like cupin family protein